MKYSKARQSKTKRNLFQNRCLRQILRIRLTDTNGSSTSISDIEDALSMFHVILGGSSTSSSDIEDV
jgi:hypothetical protein